MEGNERWEVADDGDDGQKAESLAVRMGSIVASATSTLNLEAVLADGVATHDVQHAGHLAAHGLALGVAQLELLHHLALANGGLHRPDKVVLALGIPVVHLEGKGWSMLRLHSWDRSSVNGFHCGFWLL